MMDPATASNAASWFVQVIVVAAVASGLPWALRVHAPGVRYAYWRAVLLICVALPWLQGRAATGQPAVSAPAVSDVSATASLAATHAPAAPAADWIEVFITMAIAGIAARLLWMAVGYVRLRRLRRAGEPCVDGAELQDLQEILPTRADVRYVAGLEHPVTFGRCILLPHSLKDHSPDVRRSVLAHELLHVERRDWVWLVIEELGRACFWFHPAIWWLVDRVQLSREELVDELAVTVTGRRRAYVEALLLFADHVPLRPAPAFARRHHLFRRVLLVSREAAMSSTRVVLSCAVMASIVVSGARYAAEAFPLQSDPAAQAVQADPGPLEQRAQPITPENPIPRRISHADAQMPADAAAAGARGSVTLRVTLDESGRVVEARPEGISVRLEDPPFTASYSRLRWDNVQHTARGLGEPRAAAILTSLVSAAVAAARQWQYDPPFKAPLSFPVAVWFGTPPPPPPAPSQEATAGAGGAARRLPPPPPPAPQPEMIDGALHIGGNIRPPTKIKDARPEYPAVAREARVQGVVIIEARIGPDGRVIAARVLRSIPLLDKAAIDAVMQWEFTPTLLNGNPVPVVMTMTVNFTLQ